MTNKKRGEPVNLPFLDTLTYYSPLKLLSVFVLSFVQFKHPMVFKRLSLLPNPSPVYELGSSFQYSLFMLQVHNL